jgi:hypothetical protein
MGDDYSSWGLGSWLLMVAVMAVPAVVLGYVAWAALVARPRDARPGPPSADEPSEPPVV